MISHSLGWLEQYKDQIGILIQIGLLIATAVLIRIGFMQARAANSQAKAADAQVVASNAQRESAQSQLDLSVKQLYAGLASNDAATRPLLRFETSNPIIGGAGQRLEIQVSSCGLGPALEIVAFYNIPTNDAAASFSEDFLGVGDKATGRYDLKKIQESSLTLIYCSSHKSMYKTTLHYSPEYGFEQRHDLVVNAFKQGDAK